MSSLIPAEVVTDLDLLTLDGAALTDFGNSPLAEKRRAAVYGWLRPRLEAAGYRPATHRTRRQPLAVLGIASSTVTPLTEATRTWAGAGVTAATVFASSGAVYVGLATPYRGLYLGLADAVNSTAGVVATAYWNGAWTTPNSVVDTTMDVAGKSLAQAGHVTWGLPDDWLERAIDGTFAFWTRLTCASLAAPAVVTQIAPLAVSRLTYPVARYALALLYEEGVGGNRGRWQEKATSWRDQASRELDAVLPMLADEFDVDASGAVAVSEAASVTPKGDLYTWERG